MHDSSQNKVAVITGGATGIGYAFAKALGRRGAKIVIAEPRQERLDEAIAALREQEIEASALGCDVADADSVERLADFAWQTYGHVDLLLNNAGVAQARGAVPDTSLDEVHRVFDVNFFGVWHGAAIFGKRMREQGTAAAIYNVGSENSLFAAVPQSAAYVASKHAVLGFTEALREDMPDFVTVGLVIPGWVRSELGDPKLAHMAMDTDQFVEICMPQIEAGEPYVVSHAFNMEHITNRYSVLSDAYAKYAPRYEGDEEFDVRTLIEKFKRGK